MAIKEVAIKEGEQMMFKSIELGEVVRQLKATEERKSEINEELNGEIKMLKARMYRLAAEMKE